MCRLFRTSSNTSGGGRLDGSDSDRDRYVQKKFCSLGIWTAGDAAPGSFFPSEAVGPLGGGMDLLGDGVESAPGEFGEDVDARRATRVMRAGLDCRSFLG